jgi:hypothetical protein
MQIASGNLLIFRNHRYGGPSPHDWGLGGQSTIVIIQATTA